MRCRNHAAGGVSRWTAGSGPIWMAHTFLLDFKLCGSCGTFGRNMPVLGAWARNSLISDGFFAGDGTKSRTHGSESVACDVILRCSTRDFGCFARPFPLPDLPCLSRG